MAIKKNNQYRRVKTILLCKVKPDAIRDAIRKEPLYSNLSCSADQRLPERSYPDIYKSIYEGPIKGTALRYISIGNVDAFSIYDPSMTTVSFVDHKTSKENAVFESENLDSSWFSKLYQDKQNIILQTNSDLNYHPIHLVANTVTEPPKTDWENRSRFPFCIVTLIYGIHDNSINCEPADSNDPRSSYELAINKFIKNQIIEKQIEDKRKDSGNIVYEVYNAVNICDAAVIWYTADIPSTMELSGSLSETGFAKKTFTLVGFQMDNGTGEIKEDAYDALKSESKFYNARIQGSIRDQGIYRDFLKSIKTRLSDVAIQDYLVCGQSDFTILLPDISGNHLASLLRFLIEGNTGKTIANACWDIHTELMYKASEAFCPKELNHCDFLQRPIDLKKNLADKRRIRHNSFIPILGKMFDDCRRLPSAIQEYPWYGTFYELLNVHATIDQHPVLHGPSFLVYGFVKTAIHYFKEAAKNKSVSEMLRRSLPSIQEFLRNWSDLTDQLLRIDDLVFHGFGNNSALSMTLPECALDFYHAFILEFVDFLIRVDQADGRCKNEDKNQYEYDFLLVPELHSGICIESMFLTDYIKDTQVLQNEKTHKRILWPLKQAYLVRFPIETVYSPARFFISLVHECFHFFGDACRQRKKRSQYICAFMAASIVWYLGCSSNSPQNKRLFHGIYHSLSSKFEDTPEPNRRESEQLLGIGIKELFSAKGLNEVLNKSGEDNRVSFESKTMLLRWYNGSSALGTVCVQGELASDWSSMIADCFYYFQECYADYMTICLLGLNVEEYLKLFEEDSRSTVPVKRLMTDAQRIAVVIAACIEQAVVGFDQDAVIKAFNAVTNMPESFLSVIKICCSALTDKNQSPEFSKKEKKYRIAVHPPVVLRYVVDYLRDTNRAIQFHFGQKPTSEELAILKDRYDYFFRRGNFLSKEYFSVIRRNHENVRKSI